MAATGAEGEDEVDYMSDALLQQCDDVRPGLMSKAVKRQYEISRKQKEADAQSKTKPLAVQAVEKREEGLASAIKSDNRGFALMQKMGYKPGTGIGKEGNKGRTEPVPVEVKVGRSGLGQDSEIKRKRDFREAFSQQIQIHKEKKMADLQTDFRQRLADKNSETQVLRDLSKSQKVCVELDSKNNIMEPEEHFFWPAHMPPAPSDDDGVVVEEEDEEDDDLDVEEKLDILTEYLRTTYYYCVWCGTTFTDENDLATNCPGDTADVHDE